MARTRYTNVSDEDTVELLRAGDDISVSRVSMANLNATLPVTVDLFVQKQSTGKYYMFKGVSIPALTSLIYDTSVSTGEGNFSLFIKLTKSASETPAVDVILY